MCVCVFCICMCLYGMCVCMYFHISWNKWLAHYFASYQKTQVNFLTKLFPWHFKPQEIHDLTIEPPSMPQRNHLFAEVKRLVCSSDPDSYTNRDTPGKVSQARHIDGSELHQASNPRPPAGN